MMLQTKYEEQKKKKKNEKTKVKKKKKLLFSVPPPSISPLLRQVGKPWALRKCYTGFRVTWMRTTGLVLSYFTMIDSGRRHFPEQFNRPLLGPFLASGIAATVSWWIVWPLEYMKSQVQARYGDRSLSVRQRLRLAVQQGGGVLALYRGIGPGSLRSFLANGVSMVVMVNAQRKLTEWGLRDTPRSNNSCGEEMGT